MPYVRNDNAHGVRVGNSRIPPNTTVQVSDEDAKAYEGYNGVEKVSDSEGKKAVESQRSGGSGVKSPSAELQEELASLRVAHRSASVSAPLQVVRGDDDAPLGPPSGTITTKQVAAQESPEAKRAFADHEYAEVPEGASPVEQEQAANTRQSEAVAQSLAERLASGSDDLSAETDESVADDGDAADDSKKE